MPHLDSNLRTRTRKLSRYERAVPRPVDVPHEQVVIEIKISSWTFNIGHYQILSLAGARAQFHEYIAYKLF